MNPIVLDHLTVSEATPPQVISIACAVGCQAVSLWFHAPPHGQQPYPMIGDTPMLRHTHQLAMDSGVAIFSVGIFALMPDTDVASYRGMLESGALLGAKRAICLIFDPDAARALANFCRLCELAAEYRMSVDAEFIAFSSLNSLDAAITLLDRARQSNAGMIIDPLHLTRSGGSPSDIARIPLHYIGYAQICDGPLTMPAAQQMDEGSEQRRIPGEGEFPLQDFVNALPSDVPIGVEIPLRDLMERGLSAQQRAQRAVDASRRIIAARQYRT